MPSKALGNSCFADVWGISVFSPQTSAQFAHFWQKILLH
ncbi:hypothetical protein VCHENC03_1783 [Vibrio sp. HENC-03]|nr:hypothetical protein VCHENC03_1783 [Vibrio sp. HENC-03]